MTPIRYRKKPVVIDAHQFDGTWESINGWLTALGYDEDGDGTDGGPACYMEDGELIIQTLEGDLHASPGDFIIRGVQGEFYPCKPDIFEQTYEPGGMTPAAHVPHPDTGGITHNGPGHRYGDPGYCGGCWWEQIGRYQPADGSIRHADGCPGCREPEAAS